jgi:hypothetical protein
MRNKILLLLVLFNISGLAFAEKLIPKNFNSKQFGGLVSDNLKSYDSAVLDFELKGPDGQLIKFNSCKQVEESSENDIVPSQFYNYKQLVLNCIALKGYFESSEAKRTYFPPHLTKQIVSLFPASAAPVVSKEDLDSRIGKSLKEYSKELIVKNGRDGHLDVTTAEDDIRYSILAKADFDGDGIEDWFVQADSRGRDAFRHDSCLFILKKTSPSGKVELIKRY